jgi:hypothetical protein
LAAFEVITEVKHLQARLSEYAGKQIDYLSVVRYRGGNDGMPWHQHPEDRHGGDMSVWIVRTGCQRTLSIRPKGGKREDILMAKGSLAVLPSAFNDTHEHSVLPFKDVGVCYSINAKVLPYSAGTVSVQGGNRGQFEQAREGQYRNG